MGAQGRSALGGPLEPGVRRGRRRGCWGERFRRGSAKRALNFLSAHNTLLYNHLRVAFPLILCNTICYPRHYSCILRRGSRVSLAHPISSLRPEQ